MSHEVLVGFADELPPGARKLAFVGGRSCALI
jgi:hypothetical protein